jgi:hypothetical protein
LALILPSEMYVNLNAPKPLSILAITTQVKESVATLTPSQRKVVLARASALNQYTLAMKNSLGESSDCQTNRSIEDAAPDRIHHRQVELMIAE